MSRLDSFIRRMSAQRDCLNWAAQQTENVTGVILELGLGNGRTYDHLRQLCPHRDIFVFERKVAAHPDCIPDEAHLFLGDITETLPNATRTLGAGSAALIHSDIGTGDHNANAKLAAMIAPEISNLCAANGLVLADQDLPLTGFDRIPEPDGVPAGRYFLYRKRA